MCFVSCEIIAAATASALPATMLSAASLQRQQHKIKKASVNEFFLTQRERERKSLPQWTILWQTSSSRTAYTTTDAQKFKLCGYTRNIFCYRIPRTTSIVEKRTYLQADAWRACFSDDEEEEIMASDLLLLLLLTVRITKTQKPNPTRNKRAATSTHVVHICKCASLTHSCPVFISLVSLPLPLPNNYKKKPRINNNSLLQLLLLLLFSSCFSSSSSSSSSIFNVVWEWNLAMELCDSSLSLSPSGMQNSLEPPITTKSWSSCCMYIHVPWKASEEEEEEEVLGKILFILLTAALINATQTWPQNSRKQRKKTKEKEKKELVLLPPP